MKERETFQSWTGIPFLSIGRAIGMEDAGCFPHAMGNNGGGAFALS